MRSSLRSLYAVYSVRRIRSHSDNFLISDTLKLAREGKRENQRISEGLGEMKGKINTQFRGVPETPDSRTCWT